MQAVMQAGLQKGGDLLSAGANKAGNYLMSRALNLTDRLSREFPNLPQSTLTFGLPPSTISSSFLCGGFFCSLRPS